MHRAIRLVVDTGMHAKGWTREQAIQYSLDHEAESEASIVAEIERYMAMPGQALSYKIARYSARAVCRWYCWKKKSMRGLLGPLIDAG